MPGRRQEQSEKVVCCLLVVSLAAPAMAPAQQRAQPGTPAKNAQPAQPAQTAAGDPGWPRVYSDGKATIAVHQPQVDDWKDFAKIEARSAIEIQPEKGGKKWMAAAHWRAKTVTSVAERTVVLGEIEFTSFRVPGADEAKRGELQQLAETLLPKKRDAIALDRILPYLKESRSAGRQVKISTEAPPILVSTRPAILVMIDGAPLLGPAPGSKLTFVVNTNWDLFKEEDDFYLLNDRQWLTAKALEGPWKPASKLPKGLNDLPADENWKDVKRALPLSKENKSLPAPWVYVTDRPAELILLNGEPKLAPVVAPDLSEVVNTKSLLFYHGGTKRYYFLISGRWFKNETLRGNWEFASDNLPAEFRAIPEQHPKAHVLASVPGTAQAEDAVMLASVPQVAVINRQQAAAEAKVTYVGTPEFKPVSGTSLQYATNTPSDVILAAGQYFLCQEGVWFVGQAPTGPWAVADTIPQEIYQIPPESPKHNTTYVYVTNSDSQTVTTAQTAGYLGLTIGIGIGVACWGTGYYYAPYSYWGPMYPYPVYWGYPYHSYGAAAWYNPATGFYGRGAVAYGPYGGYGRAAAYNPATGAYVRRSGAYGPYQAGMATSFYNPRTGAWGGGYRYANPYQGWGQGVVAKGDQWARGGYYYDDRGAIGGIRTSQGGGMVAAGNGDRQGMIGRTSDGDLYVGKDGEIYRRNAEGGWQHRGDGGWNNVNYDSLSPEQKQRVDSAKQKGAEARQNNARAGTTERAQPGTARAQGSTMERAQPGTMQRPQTGTMERPQPGTTQRPRPGTAQSATGSTGGMRPATANRDVMSGLDRDAGARAMGNRNANSWNRGGGRSFSGGGRMGGRRR